MEVQNATDLFKVAEIELVYHSLPGQQQRPVIKTAAAAYKVFRDNWDMNKIELQEQFKVILLNTGSACLGIVDISTGSVKGCIVDTRLIFAAALKANAVSIILAHNHPSGNLEPSTMDKTLTEKIAAAGELLDIPIRDHLIITTKAYKSFFDDGLIT